MSDRIFSLEWKLPEYMIVLPRFYDRIEASRHFLIQAEEKIPDKLKTWYARASLNELKSAINLIEKDTKDIGLGNEWKESQERKLLRNDLVMKLVCGARDLSFHAGTIDSSVKERMVRVIGVEESKLYPFKVLYINGMLGQGRGTGMRLSRDEANQIAEIIDGIPLFMLLSDCYRISHMSVERFLLAYKRLNIVETTRFWEKLRW